MHGIITVENISRKTKSYNTKLYIHMWSTVNQKSEFCIATYGLFSCIVAKKDSMWP